MVKIRRRCRYSENNCTTRSRKAVEILALAKANARRDDPAFIVQRCPSVLDWIEPEKIVYGHH